MVSVGRGSTSGSGRCPSAFRGPPLDAARRSTFEPRLSLATRLQGQRFRLCTVPERVSASRLVSAGRGSTSGSGRCPSAFRGPPPRCCQAQHFRASLEPCGSFLLAGAALQALDGARARFGAPPLDAARRSTFELRGSFLLAGAALQALDGARARFGAPPPRCCQAQHF